MLWEGNRQIQEYTDQLIFTTVYDQDSFEPVSRLVQSRDKDCDDLKIYHYHNNHLGTPQELTDDCGNVVWCNYEFAWGGTYQSYYKEQSLNDITIKDYELQPIKFQGQSLDIETGLHYNRFRYYDSDVGMFISRDPIGLLGGNNVFQYVPNPIHWVDVLGLNCTNNTKTTKNTPDTTTGIGYGVNDPPVRVQGEWSKQDIYNGLMGRTPKGLGSPDLHHAHQMPGSAIHEVLPDQHRGNKALHPNKFNQGVTAKMRQEDKELHWWYRAREQGADDIYPHLIYD
ncbi:RHS repeat-associated core domain-containing protein [Moraxella cuniculi DSM 21768]|uniref:RHS repeat-associated core domain-containing protein n=1 Tax=Moraxella cuniculi DSM 21768 TaxID=1122245 RepID=A0A1N7G1B2_9GAMM|nr:RHS repeat-associated core domain-containing protein [Moraxella cuniculi]SIS06338.1 RHS repeat-associated core domain-containing protein [Moraxella cuniculi DSM 21768]